jgi:metal-responsive CopG/Arc/MetJ family transcriptional regulator
MRTRRAEQPGTLVGVRLQPDALSELDAWVAEQAGRKPTRPEAIRRLIKLGLAAAAREQTELR